MEVSATMKFVRMSPTKCRDLARRLCGKPVNEALKVTQMSERKGAFNLGKTLRSAIANAQNNAKLAPEELWVSKAVVDEGPRLKRHWPRARGMASPVQKRTCHINVVLSDAPRARSRGK